MCQDYFSCAGSLSASWKGLPSLKCNTLLAGTFTFSPVLGFLAIFAFLCLILKLPKPRISIFSPRARASFIPSKIVLIIVSTCFFVSPSTFSVTCSINTDFVICLLLLELISHGLQVIGFFTYCYNILPIACFLWGIHVFQFR